MALEFRPAEGAYVATAIDLPGYYARGVTRTEVGGEAGEELGGSGLSRQQPLAGPQEELVERATVLNTAALGNQP